MTIRDFFETTTFDVDKLDITITKGKEKFWFFDKSEIPPELLDCKAVVTATIEKDFDIEDFTKIWITCTLCLEFVIK